MLAIKFVLLAGSLTALVVALFILLFDAHKVTHSPEPVQVRWRRATRLMLLAVILLLPGLSIVVVPSGMAGVRVSQLSGTLGAPLYPGTHFVTPLVQRVGMYNVRDQDHDGADGREGFLRQRCVEDGNGRKRPLALHAERALKSEC
jgi:hypothetical protein